MLRKCTAVCLSLALVGTAACGGGDLDPETPEQGLSLMSQLDYGAETKVKEIDYTITPVSCKTGEVYEDGKVVEATKPIKKDIGLPAGIEKFIDEPFDEFSSHKFADFFVNLDAGCYHVAIQPRDKDGKAICRPAETPKKDPAKVVKGKTEEILLISQCPGKKRGALDVVAALNHPPSIELLTMDPQKFVKCPVDGKPKVTLCAFAEDKDLDPMNFDWKAIKGRDQIKDVKVLGPDHGSYSDPGFAGECIEVTFKREDTAIKGKVTVFDKFVEFVNGERKLITAEDWYVKNKYGNIKSRDSLKFPLYIAGCDPEFVCARSPGYWQTPAGTQEDKPQLFEKRKAKWADEVGVDIETKELCDGELWDDILRVTPKDAYHRLAFQYIAARLNEGMGATLFGDIELSLDVAEALLTSDDICDVKSRITDSDYVMEALEAEGLTDFFTTLEQLKDDIESFNTFCSPDRENKELE